MDEINLTLALPKVFYLTSATSKMGHHIIFIVQSIVSGHPPPRVLPAEVQVRHGRAHCQVLRSGAGTTPSAVLPARGVGPLAGGRGPPGHQLPPPAAAREGGPAHGAAGPAAAPHYGAAGAFAAAALQPVQPHTDASECYYYFS